MMSMAHLPGRSGRGSATGPTATIIWLHCEEALAEGAHVYLFEVIRPVWPGALRGLLCCCLLLFETLA
jgi:hypothetical protein